MKLCRNPDADIAAELTRRGIQFRRSATTRSETESAVAPQGAAVIAGAAPPVGMLATAVQALRTACGTMKVPAQDVFAACTWAMLNPGLVHTARVCFADDSHFAQQVLAMKAAQP